MCPTLLPSAAVEKLQITNLRQKESACADVPTVPLRSAFCPVWMQTPVLLITRAAEDRTQYTATIGRERPPLLYPARGEDHQPDMMEPVPRPRTKAASMYAYNKHYVVYFAAYRH